jgi:hypothetical protein
MYRAEACAITIVRDSLQSAMHAFRKKLTLSRHSAWSLVSMAVHINAKSVGTNGSHGIGGVVLRTSRTRRLVVLRMRCS